jgi:integrase
MLRLIFLATKIDAIGGRETMTPSTTWRMEGLNTAEGLPETFPWVHMARGRRKKGPPLPYRSFRTVFATACRHAKLTDVTPHALRHSFASQFVMQAVDLRTVEGHAGGKSLNMVQRCAHLSNKHKRQAVALLAKSSTSILAPPLKNDETREDSKSLIT